MFADDIDRPLRMPEKYDFSARMINWNNYKKEHLLRTDAVWEKEKLRSYFYTIYKGVLNIIYLNSLIRHNFKKSKN